MAKETFANRAELRRRLRARMGASTNDAVQVQTTEQQNELLREAAQTVRDACEWKRTVVEYFFSTGIDQRYYNYPANSGPGDIKRVFLWDGDANGGNYIPLYKRQILPFLDNDPILVGAPEVATRGQPSLWEESSQQVGGLPVPALEINPLPDDVYKMKVEFVQAAELLDDTTPSISDANCIVGFALAELLDMRGKPQLADKQRAKAQQRVKLLAGAQRSAETIRIGRGETVALRAGVRLRIPPNFDTGLSVMPSP